MKLLIIIFFTGLVLNPRIVFKSQRPDYFISCSTGWSFHWKGFIVGKGLAGLYSPENAAWSSLSLDKNQQISLQLKTDIKRKALMETCSNSTNKINKG